MEFYLRRNLLIQLVVSYVAVLLLPVIIAMISHYNLLSRVSRDAQEANAAMLKQGIVAVDSRLEEIERRLVKITSDAKLLSLGKASSPYEDSRSLYRIRELQNVIKNLSIGDPFKSQCQVYFYNSDVVITSAGSFLRLSDFFSHFFTPESFDITQWRDWLMDKRWGTQRYFPANILKTQPVEAELQLFLVRNFPIETSTKAGIALYSISFHQIFELLNGISAIGSKHVAIYDQNNTLIAVNDNAEIKYEAVDSTENGQIITVGNERMLLTTAVSSFNGWRYVALTPYSLIQEKVSMTQRNTSFALTTMMLAGLIVALVMAFKTGKPINRLVTLIHPMGKEKNAYEALTGSVLELITSNEDMRKRIEQQEPLIKATMVRMMLLGEYESSGTLYEAVRILGLPDQPNPMRTIILRILREGDAALELSMLKLIVKDSLEKAIGATVLYYDIDRDKRAFILSGKAISERKTIEQALNNTNITLINEYHTQIFFSVGECIDSYTALPVSYEGALEALKHSAPDKNQILFSSDLPTGENRFSYPPSMENQLLNYVKLGNHIEATQLISRLRHENLERRSLAPDMIALLSTELFSSLIKAYDLLDVEGITSPELWENIQLIDPTWPISHVFNECSTIIAALCNIANENRSNRNNILIKEVIEWMEQDYADAQMSLTMMAERCKISSAYLSHIFKVETGENFTTRLERMRVEKAYGLLQSGMIISDVADKVGYNSVSVFRKAFKRVKGLLPSEVH